MDDRSSRYVPALTGLRAIAAFLVFLHHYPPPLRWMRAVTVDLHIGVAVFFVLSGFLIANRYADYEFSRARLFDYFRNRFARIYPLYALLAVLALVHLHRTEPMDWFLDLTLLRSVGTFAGIPQAWTLTVEESFYCLAPLIFWLSRRTGLLLPLFAIYGVGLAVYSIGLGTAHTVILYSFLGRCFEFFVGIYLARSVRLGSRPSLGIPLTYLGFLGVATCVAGLVSLQSPETGIRFGLYHPLGIVINNFALPVFVALLIYGLIGEKTVAKFLLGTRLMDILGRSSYAFYLIHMGAIHVWVKNCLPGKGGYIYSVRFLALQVIAVALYILVEEPLRKLLRIRPTPQLRAANVEPSVQRAA